MAAVISVPANEGNFFQYQFFHLVLFPSRRVRTSSLPTAVALVRFHMPRERFVLYSVHVVVYAIQYCNRARAFAIILIIPIPNALVRARTFDLSFSVIKLDRVILSHVCGRVPSLCSDVYFARSCLRGRRRLVRDVAGKRSNGF